MKKLLYMAGSTEDLIRIQKILNNANIAFEAKPPMTSMIQSILHLVFYHVLSTGLERKKEVIGIYVEKDVYETANTLINMRL